MRCHICDKILSPEEIHWNRDHGDWDPCGGCLEIINHVFEPPSEEEIDAQLSLELFYDELQDAQNTQDEIERDAIP